jgi:serine/threonine-protein kinase RsbW
MTEIRTEPTGTGTTAPGVVRLVIPAEARYLRLVRLTASGLAGDLGYGTDALEDLRIAVDELCASVIEDSVAGSELTVSYRETDGALEVEGVCDDASTSAPELHSVARELLAMLADDYEVGSDDRGRVFRMTKRPRPGE